MLGALSAVPLLPAIVKAGAPLEKLSLWGPPAAPTITLAHAVATGRFKEVANEVTFTPWRNPDELRAGLTSGEIIASIVPAQAAANLYNRGFPIRLANIMTEGLLYVLSEDATIQGFPDLNGRKVAVPFRGDTPEILFTQLLRHHGVSDNDVDVMYVATPIEAVQLLLAGRVDVAMVVEPASSAAIMRGKQAGKQIKRVIDITRAWGDMTGGPTVIPMAGLAVTKAIYEDQPDLLAPLQAALQQAVAEVNADPARAAGNASEGLGLPAPVIAASIPNARLVVKSAKEMRGPIEAMFRAMTGNDFKRLGGKLPDDQFYL